MNLTILYFDATAIWAYRGGQLSSSEFLYMLR